MLSPTYPSSSHSLQLHHLIIAISGIFHFQFAFGCCFWFFFEFWANVNCNGDTVYDTDFTFPYYYRAKEIAILPKSSFLVHMYYFHFLELSFKNEWQMCIYLLWRSVLCEKWSILKSHVVLRKLIRKKLYLNKNMYFDILFKTCLNVSINYYILSFSFLLRWQIRVWKNNSVFISVKSIFYKPCNSVVFLCNIIWSCGCKPSKSMKSLNPKKQKTKPKNILPPFSFLCFFCMPSAH